jgi:hypothetical protein
MILQSCYPSLVKRSAILPCIAPVAGWRGLRGLRRPCIQQLRRDHEDCEIVAMNVVVVLAGLVAGCMAGPIESRWQFSRTA